jgi:hypothetical protein
MRTIVISDDKAGLESAGITKPLKADDHLHKVTKTDLSKAVVLTTTHSGDHKEISANMAVK